MDLLHTALDTLNAIGLEKVFLLLMAPVFAVCMAAEAWHLARRGRQTYSFGQVSTNIVLALSHAVTDGLAWALVLGLFHTLYRHRLFEIPASGWSLLLLVVLQDFFYYWFHRGSHRIRWMWASHVTHHSSETMNLATALRQSLTYPLSGMWLFWLPLAWIGFQPETVVLVVAISLAYQFFVHTESIRKLPGWVEAVFNTPSHHRVHHARNAQYIDRNYAGVLIIWDKLFGTYVAETEAPEYGIVRQIHSRNPLVMMFHEWRDLFRDFARPGPLSVRLKHAWAPPEWVRPGA
ncbi:MAG: sterol desaturase family protein [Stagnimonas sp.]|nr:sterol desaturase family protein [Stagnimonas sp.]